MFGIKTSYLIVLAGVGLILILGLLSIVLQKLKINLGTSSVTWRGYLRGQGLLLFLFLLIGIGLAVFFDRLGPSDSKIIAGGQLVQLRDVNPSEHPIYEELDVENYSQITILAKVSAPDAGSASITAYIDQSPSGRGPIEHIDCAATSWSEWQRPNRGKHLSLVAAPSVQPGAVTATKMDVFIYLSPK